MESRKVTIINSRSQSQKIIENSTATTLGELKKEMDNAGIDYRDMTFYEGHLRAELKDDSSVLPEEIPYKGEIVRDLVFLLTVPDKKIKSGAMTRKEVYEAIKAKGLQGECVKKFGKNFTMCKTEDLVGLLEAPLKKAEKIEVKEKVKTVKAVSKKSENTEDKETKEGKGINLKSFLKTLLDDLFSNNALSEEVYDDLMDELGEGKIDRSEVRETIREMFDFVG